MLFNESGLIPVIVSGSATTYYCDGLWFDNTQIYYVSVGGCSNNLLGVGVFCSALLHVSLAKTWDISASISCKPLATT